MPSIGVPAQTKEFPSVWGPVDIKLLMIFLFFAFIVVVTSRETSKTIKTILTRTRDLPLHSLTLTPEPCQTQGHKKSGTCDKQP